ncbi:MAG TPA: hypothetical protein VM432_12550, partial [Bdellovibrionales bacterium]|nr:hypothetical protein [Bdellovibrionales bacterium]
MFEIQIKSPTRVDLAGGTLDCWPLYLFLDTPVTINVAIDIFTYADLRERNDGKVELHSADLNARKTYTNLSECLADSDPAFDLVRACVAFFNPEKGFTLSTRSESPIGGGLGGSSSLCISLLKAFSAWTGKTFEHSEMVRVASHIEARVLLKPTGTQDYFPPIFGGMNVISYGVRGPEVEVRPIDTELFRDRFLLVYTGRSHHSGINNWQVIKNWLDGDEPTRAALRKLSKVSHDMNKALLERREHDLPALFEREFEARCELSEGFSSPEIRRLSELARANGGIAKICGAGGGGCVLIWCPDRQLAKIKTVLEKEKFQVLATQPWSNPTTRPTAVGER